MKQPVLIVLAGCMGSACVVAAVIGASRYLAANKDAAHTAAVHCAAAGTKHEVVIHNGTVSPEETTAKLCDSLTITNDDDRLRLMAFGRHDDHQAYDGITEEVLSKNQSLTVLLDQPGTYKFHDHLADEVQGLFTVIDQ